MLGEKIRDIRTLKRLSQENMADLPGIATTAYGDIERNKTELSFQCLLQIAGILEVDISCILSFGEEIPHLFPRPATKARHYNRKELLFALENQKLEIEKLLAAIAQLKAKKEKTELELKYLMEKLDLALLSIRTVTRSPDIYQDYHHLHVAAGSHSCLFPQSAFQEKVKKKLKYVNQPICYFSLFRRDISLDQ
ncbi:hypothetical protein DYBT9275_03285 [Dyadobacter sp. CECT 9275]|uniref:HTH cro/C1-type domain-containing protein n=2 Tax=Dyadobacter helix TaxID=2822344 RepID=A0A916JFU9_9BACT|nr:hypothetical protein DYBT9275_03285 [Dyadobacter sp. CECT 9275]